MKLKLEIESGCVERSQLHWPHRGDRRPHIHFSRSAHRPAVPEHKACHMMHIYISSSVCLVSNILSGLLPPGAATQMPPRRIAHEHHHGCHDWEGHQGVQT